MFCANCGRKREPEEKFCADCGTRFEATPNPTVTPVQPNEQKKKSGSKLAIIITLAVIGIIVLGVVGIISLVLATLGKYETQEYVKLGTDQVATIYNVVGQREIRSYNSAYSDGERIVSFGYVKDAISDEDLEKYGEALLEEDFYYYRDIDTEFSYVKVSSKTGMIIVVYTTYESDNKITMNYQLSYGDMEDFNEYIETNKKKEIGSKEYGYIQIPEDWEEFEDTSDLNFIQYVNQSEKSFVALYAQKEDIHTIEEYVDAFIATYDEKDLDSESQKTTVLGYEAYVITTIEDGIKKKEWLFIDDNETLRYIALGAQPSNSEVFDLINCYYINKKAGL